MVSNTKRYLEAFSEDGPKLSQDQMATDMKVLSEQINSAAKKPVLLVGWSQGAGMAVLAASHKPSQLSSAEFSLSGCLVRLFLVGTGRRRWQRSRAANRISPRSP